jgi:NitT/TauT family transport system ATP-binding protein
MAAGMASVSALRSAGAPAQDAAEAILVADNIVKRFETPDGVITAVDHVSFAVKSGEFLTVIGPSGCGKSTLFNVVGGLIDEYEGRVTVAGDTVRGPHPAIGMIFQEESTFPWRTVIDNVAFPLEISGMPKKERLEKARHFVNLVGLDGFERRYPSELSGGMRQRVSMARTLASEPKILLMDEPFAALDEQTRLLLGDKVLQIQQAQSDRSGAALRPHPGDDVPAGQGEAHRRYQTAAAAHLGDCRQRRVRPLRGADLA